VHLASGRIFVAHTGAGAVEVIGSEERLHVRTISGCPEASGILPSVTRAWSRSSTQRP
jgi:hypothetical protein